MTMKSVRQKKILELINQYSIETQEELVQNLINSGFDVTQATVSRDIRELEITKMSINGKKQRYVAVKGADTGLKGKLLGILKTGFVSVEEAGNILVVKTSSGMAMAVAASLDALNWSEIVGCIAGDDTIFCAIKTIDDVEVVKNRLNDIIAK